MDPRVLAAELDREPFVPLLLRLSDGRTIEVRNPGLCFIAHLSLYTFAAKPNASLAQDVQVVSLRHIVSVEPLPSQHAA